MRYAFLKQCWRAWAGFMLAAVLLQSGARAFLYFWYLPTSVRAMYGADAPALFWTGLRFDVQAAAYLLAPAVVLALLCLPAKALLPAGRRLQAVLPGVLLTVLALLVLGNIFYFKEYERQFDVFVFGLFDEDTRAVLRTIWSDFPVLWMLGGAAVLALLIGFWQRRLWRPVPAGRERPVFTAVLALAAVVLTALAMRGSLGKFPLRQASAQVSPAVQLNRLVANAPLSLKWAVRDYQNSRIFKPVQAADGARLLQTLLNRPQADADLGQLLHKAPAWPDAPARRPNVVLAVMESMGSHLMLAIDQPNRDFLGALREPFAKDWVFRRFVSEGDGTSDSLQRFFVRSPNIDVSQSAAKRTRFVSNMFAPYTAAGYRVLFITGGNGGWRNLAGFLPLLGVDEVIDEAALREAFPKAPAYTWGVPDEYMFAMAERKLQEADAAGRPVFIMMMSVTNHPPYRLPAPYQMRDMAVKPAERERFKHFSASESMDNMLNTFYYANDQLGRFIAAVKKSAPDTLIAATGDHNLRAIGYPKPEEIALGHGVPFYLYVPPAYRRDAVFDPARVGSHKDIMPTLNALALYGMDYYQSGCNLLAAKPADNPFCGYGYNPEVLLLPDGFYLLKNHEFRRWTGDAAGNPYAAETVPSPLPAADAKAVSQGGAYGTFLHWQLNRMVKGLAK